MMKRLIICLVISLSFSFVASAQLYKQDKKYKESDSTSTNDNKEEGKTTKKTYKKENSSKTTPKKTAPKKERPMTKAEKKKAEEEEAEREAKTPKGIVAYFYQFPKEFLPVVSEFMDKKQEENPHLKLRDDNTLREQIIRYKNVDKGYIMLQKPGDTKYTKMQVFKMNNGNLLMAVEESDCNNAFCNSSMKFYSNSSGSWSDVTDTYKPEIDNKYVISSLKARYKREYKDLDLYTDKAYEDNEANLKKAIMYTIVPDEGKIAIQEQYLPTTLYEMIWDGKKDKFDLKKVDKK
jgi:hypothetical protein